MPASARPSLALVGWRPVPPGDVLSPRPPESSTKHDTITSDTADLTAPPPPRPGGACCANIRPTAAVGAGALMTEPGSARAVVASTSTAVLSDILQDWHNGKHERPLGGTSNEPHRQNDMLAPALHANTPDISRIGLEKALNHSSHMHNDTAAHIVVDYCNTTRAGRPADPPAAIHRKAHCRGP